MVIRDRLMQEIGMLVWGLLSRDGYRLSCMFCRWVRIKISFSQSINLFQLNTGCHDMK
jgi:hypothetical protein